MKDIDELEHGARVLADLEWIAGHLEAQNAVAASVLLTALDDPAAVPGVARALEGLDTDELLAVVAGRRAASASVVEALGAAIGRLGRWLDEAVGRGPEGVPDAIARARAERSEVLAELVPTVAGDPGVMATLEVPVRDGPAVVEGLAADLDAAVTAAGGEYVGYDYDGAHASIALEGPDAESLWAVVRPVVERAGLTATAVWRVHGR